MVDEAVDHGRHRHRVPDNLGPGADSWTKQTTQNSTGTLQWARIAGGSITNANEIQVGECDITQTDLNSLLEG